MENGKAGLILHTMIAQHSLEPDWPTFQKFNVRHNQPPSSGRRHSLLQHCLLPHFTVPMLSNAQGVILTNCHLTDITVTNDPPGPTGKLIPEHP